jgi:hypothetical protein
MDAGLYSNRAEVMFENVGEWHLGGKRSPAEVKVSLGLSTSIQLNLRRCEVRDRALLDHTIWRVKDEPVTHIATEPVCFWRGIPKEQLDAVIDEMIPHALQLLASDPVAIRSKALTAAYKKSISEQDGVIDFSNSPVALTSWLTANKQNLFLTNALRIWVAQTSFFKNHWRIVEGAESVNAVHYEPLGAALVPRMLTLQLERAVEVYMKELEQDFLHRLENMVFSRDPLSWLPTYLAIFVYLSTLEGDTWDLEEWTAGVGVLGIPESQQKLWPRKTELSTYIDRNHHQADMIITHAKAALGKGQLPFSTNSTGELVPTPRIQDKEAYELAAQLAEQLDNYGEYSTYITSPSFPVGFAVDVLTTVCSFYRRISFIQTENLIFRA